MKRHVKGEKSEAAHVNEPFCDDVGYKTNKVIMFFQKKSNSINKNCYHVKLPL